MHGSEIMAARYAEHEKIRTKAKRIDWFIGWLRDQTSRAIMEWPKDDERYEDYKSLCCSHLTFCLGNEATGQISCGYDSGSFRLVIGNKIDDQRVSARSLSITKIVIIHDEVLPYTVDKLCGIMPWLRERLERSLFDHEPDVKLT